MKAYLGGVLAIGRSAHFFTSLLFGVWVGVLAAKSGSTVNGLRSGFVTLMVTVGVFLKNDVMDVQADKISKPYRPLASGKLNPGSVSRYAYVLYCSSIAACVWFTIFSWPWIILLAYCLLLLGYDYVKRHYAWGKGLYVGVSLAVALVFAAIVGERWTLSIFSVILSFAFYVTFRECLLDVRDAEGDESVGVRTLAVRYGKGNAMLLAELFWVLSCVVLFFVTTNLVRDIVIIVGFQFFSAIAFVANRDSSSWHGGAGLVLQWIPMMLLAVLTVTI